MIHGIPSTKVVLREGDIVSIDTGAAVHGWNGDNAWTVACGQMCIRDRAEGALYASKVVPVCPKGGKATRVGHTVKDGKKVRVCKKCCAEF